MKQILTISLAIFFLLGCAQQRVEVPGSTERITKLDTKEVKSSNISKGKAVEIDLNRPEAANSTSIESSDEGLSSSPILKMVGSALLTGIISGLVSKALQ